MDRSDQPIVRDDAGNPIGILICKRRCKTCIFWPDDRNAVTPERAREVIDANLEADALLTCHSTLGTDHPAVCNGFWIAHQGDVLAARIAMRFLDILWYDDSNGSGR